MDREVSDIPGKIKEMRQSLFILTILTAIILSSCKSSQKAINSSPEVSNVQDLPEEKKKEFEF